jgi:hypothetical protein
MNHLILFSDKDFRGDHKHIFDKTGSLSLITAGTCTTDCSWPSSVSSIVVISGNWRFFAESYFAKPYEVVLGPGLYRFVGTYKLENDNIRSLEPVDQDPTIAGEPLTAYLTLFEHASFRGDHVHVFDAEPDLGDTLDFAGTVSSLMVELGNWSFYSDSQFDGSYPDAPVVGPGIYSNVTELGIGNDSIASLQPVTDPPTVSNAVEDHVILFRYQAEYGEHRHVVAPEDNLNANDDDTFNDAVRSLAILAGSWWFYSDAGFEGLYGDGTPLAPGLYADVGQAGLVDDDLSSLRPVYEQPVTTGETIWGEVILFRDANFGGLHKHVINAEANLNANDDDAFNDQVSSFVIVQGNWKFYRNAGFNDDYPAVLGPGLYGSVEQFKIRNDDMSSLQVVTAEPNMPPGAPLTAHMLLFEHVEFHGDHRHLFQEVDSLDASFNDKTSSIVVLAGTWSTFADPGLNTPFAPRLGPGLYSVLPEGIDNDTISSVTPSDRPATLNGEILLGQVLLFEHGSLHGAHKHIFNAEINLNADDDDSFNDVTSSLVVFPGNAGQVAWHLYRDADYHAAFDVLLGAGRFPSLTPIHVVNDELSSLELAGAPYDFAGSVTVLIKSGTFPDPIEHDITLSFVLLASTNVLLLAKSFDPFPGPTVFGIGSTISMAGAGTGNLLPDGTMTVSAAHITVAPTLGSNIDIIFDLTTGAVVSPNGDLSDTGIPRDAGTGKVKLVGAGRSNGDDFLVTIQGTLNPRPA